MGGADGVSSLNIVETVIANTAPTAKKTAHFGVFSCLFMTAPDWQTDAHPYAVGDMSLN